LPLERASLDLVVIADALHFLDAELTAQQIARVLAPRGALALITCGFGQTPFMRGMVRLMEEAAPRRPRALTQSIVHLSALSGVPLTDQRRFHDETPIDHPRLERILRSISFIGPAMNVARFAALRERVHALPEAPAWARTFVLRSGRREGKTTPARQSRHERSMNR
jgi:SAM-dependent methyltransferase